MELTDEQADLLIGHLIVQGFDPPFSPVTEEASAKNRAALRKAIAAAEL